MWIAARLRTSCIWLTNRVTVNVYFPDVNHRMGPLNRLRRIFIWHVKMALLYSGFSSLVCLAQRGQTLITSIT